jgi:hypothetical protein
LNLKPAEICNTVVIAELGERYKSTCVEIVKNKSGLSFIAEEWREGE